jgi:hypothetical protein
MKICANCFQDEEIRQFINSTASEIGTCDYCKEESAIIDVEELLDFFTEFLSIFRLDENGVSLISLIQEHWKIFINNEVGKTMLSDILTLIPNIDLKINTNVSYLSEISDCVYYWETLKNALKWERRFLTDAERIDEFGWSSLFYINAKIDSKIDLYRARIHFSGETNNAMPVKDMGAPPQKEATPGRANPNGIPYLYLSKSPETTLYEIRSNYFDFVSIGRFVVEGEPLHIVDFTSHPSPLNHEEDMIDLAKSKLLKEAISRDLSKPMRRFDTELEYIPTQFICEYIRYNTGADGIQFHSSLHQRGVNIVLFNPERVKCQDVELHQVIDIQITSERKI